MGFFGIGFRVIGWESAGCVDIGKFLFVFENPKITLDNSLLIGYISIVDRRFCFE
jgi:hypothetical protein